MPSSDPPAAPLLDTVVFDLGGVLIDWNPRHLYRRLFDEEAAMETFLREVCSPQWNERQDAGRPWQEAVAELSALHPAHAPLIAAYHARWPEMLGGALDATVAVLDELRGQGVRLYALTNWSHETFPIARERYPFLQWFEGVLVSGEERLVKPDPAIFALLCERYAIDPARAVFIDDAPRNVHAAAATGMQALQFCDAAMLREDLVALGLLPPRADAAAP
ncbi:HAD family phosphatase [Xanthomonas sp. 3498]|uniref:HAD family hydrolase n=1 Tax=Xanthomonas sp. 3498 TaxID=2663863 RepID=UPI001622A1C7|nr:HAD family phosphatase [Xanthomonas sp. 3498]MBB5876709.1 2-haloacid dehalogenase [Xanthomonas sp. 3498]